VNKKNSKQLNKFSNPVIKKVTKRCEYVQIVTVSVSELRLTSRNRMLYSLKEGKERKKGRG
jgi:hypothetical protein